jgi:hypothetical protein
MTPRDAAIGQSEYPDAASSSIQLYPVFTPSSMPTRRPVSWLLCFHPLTHDLVEHSDGSESIYASFG